MLTASAAQLGEVRVFGKQDLVTAENGNLSVNVAGSTTAAGQTAYDLLRRAPGVAISRDNVVSLNSKQGVRLMLDGKLVYLELVHDPMAQLSLMSGLFFVHSIFASIQDASVDAIAIEVTPEAERGFLAQSANKILFYNNTKI